MSIGHKIYFDKELQNDSPEKGVDYFIEREYEISLVEGVPIRMCIATEIVKFDDRNRHKEIIRFDRDGKVKERISYRWEKLINIVDYYKYNDHTRRDIIEYGLNGHHIKEEWYDVENGDLIYRGTNTTGYDDNGKEIYNDWINAGRNVSCWKWITEYSDNGKSVKKSHYKGPQLSNFSHSLYYKYDENGNELEKRIVHQKGSLSPYSKDSIETNSYEEGKIISHIAKYVFPDGRESIYEEDFYNYVENRLSNIHHTNNRETQYFYNQLGQLYLEVDLKDGKVISIINYYYDDKNNEILEVWNSISDHKRTVYEYRYDGNGNKIYEKRTEESSRYKKVTEREWEFIYHQSSVLVSKDY